MKMYKIPNTDLEVSRIAYGSMKLGETWDATPITDRARTNAPKILHTVVDQGINLIDMADIYMWGKSDTLIGEVIAKDPGFRDKVLLQAKGGIILSGQIHDGSATVYDFSYEHLMDSINTTLKRLNTDHVDTFILHRPDALVEPEEVARAFDEMHSTGKVRYFGVSNHTTQQLELLKKYVNQPIVINQIQLSLLHNGLIDDGLRFNNKGLSYTSTQGTLDYCRLHDMVIQAWSPVAKGIIFDPPNDAPENVKALAEEVTRLAEKYDTTKEGIVLGWLLRHPAIIQPIVGTVTQHRIINSVKADTVEITKLEWYTLLAKANGKNVP